MNLVGKIFVVLIFVMSLVFMSFALAVYATHKNWREEITRTPDQIKGTQKVGFKYALEEARNENQRLKNEIDQLRNTLAAEKAARIAALAKAEAENQTLRNTNETLRAENAKQAENLAKAVEELKIKQDNLASLRREVEGLRENIRVVIADRDKQFNLASQLTDRLNANLGQLAVLKERNEDLAAKVSRLTLVLTKAGIPPETDPTASPPPLRGRVVEVSRDNLVEVSLGSDDGVLEGHELEVFRDMQYLGRVRVIRSEPNRSIAAVLPEFRQGVILRGDRVATRTKS